MLIKDALLLGLLGVVVVGVGLVLTQVLVHFFSVLNGLEAWWVRRKRRTTPGAAVVQAPVSVLPVTGPTKPVDPEVITVITAVLEIELRLRASLVEGRFTFSR